MPEPPAPLPLASLSSASSDGKVVKAIIATAAITIVIAGIFLFFYHRHMRRRQKVAINKSFRRSTPRKDGIRKGNRTVKGVNVDENGRDAPYMKNVEDKRVKQAFTKALSNHCYEEKQVKMVDVTTAERSRKSRPRDVFLHEQCCPIGPEEDRVKQQTMPMPSPAAKVLMIPPLSSIPSPPAKEVKAPALPPPPTPAPPPPPPPIPPPPPPLAVKRSSTPPPPLPPRAGGLVSSLRPPPAPKMKANNKSRAPIPTEESIKETGDGHTKLKPLHWDKVIANADHSMVWDHINDGSLRFDDGLIEALFGYTTSNRRSPQGSGVSTSSSTPQPTPPAQLFILEPRKSQNKAIVLKSLTVSRKEILDAVLEGHGLTTDILEKLSRISPTQEEETKILQFNGNPTKLADAESFLFYILKAVPSAFTRINAMLFRSNYDAEILHLKESLQTLELGCKELRNRGLFFKLLEAILKAGNRLNAGTSRGNAQGFNLSTLRKLSDIKSTDGKTTLLHFVVEQVVRSEGRRCALNRNQMIETTSSRGRLNNDLNADSDYKSAEEINKEYLLLGLPVLGELSVEFSHVKKPASIEYESFINTCSSLTARVAEIRLLMTRCSNGEAGGFVRDMTGFLEECEAELKVVAEEQVRVINLVKRTTEYYQAGSAKQKEAQPLQLFVIVKDFLDMVDQVCVDISRKLQTKKTAARSALSSPPSPPTRNPARFPELRLHLTSDVSQSTSFSESYDDF